MATKTKARFEWSDPFLLDRQITDDERMIRTTARDYCRDKLLPRALGMFRNEGVDTDIFREFGALDMLGIVIPEEYGGAGLGYVAYGLVAREVERIDSGFRSMMSVQGSLVMVPINEFGTEAQKQKFLPKLATGEWIGCFGDILAAAIRLGGTITGEHGVGRTKKAALPDQLGDEVMALTRRVKDALDPLGILNPGAVL